LLVVEAKLEDEIILKKVISLVEKVRRESDLYSRESGDVPWQHA